MNTKKTMHAETDPDSKRRGSRFWLSRFALLLGLGALFYYGYCWGLWGRSSLLLQYLFQCGCPIASEEARYPKQVDVIVPACQHVNSRLSPSGHLLHVQGENSGIPTTYLLDLETNERSSFTLPESTFYFLTDDLLYVILYQEGGEYIFDRATENLYPIKKFTSLPSNLYANGHAEALRRAKYVFLVNDNDTVVALAPDFPTSSERNFLISRFDIQGRAPNRVEQFLQENNIVYQIVLASFPHEVVSPNGRLRARDDGIYLVESNILIAEAPPSLVRGWITDGRGVIYSSSGRCLLRRSVPFADDIECAIDVLSLF